MASPETQALQPMLGNLLQLKEKKPYMTFTKWAEMYEPIYSIRTGATSMVVVSSNEIAKENEVVYHRLFHEGHVTFMMQRESFCEQNLLQWMLVKDKNYDAKYMKDTNYEETMFQLNIGVVLYLGLTVDFCVVLDQELGLISKLRDMMIG
ncbi:hypothetical protein Lser_V15G23302 [Lactuca serriola]